MLSRIEIWQIVYEVTTGYLKVQSDYVRYTHDAEICQVALRLHYAPLKVEGFREEVHRRLSAYSCDRQVVILAEVINCLCSLSETAEATSLLRSRCVNILFEAQRCSETPAWFPKRKL